MTNDRFNDHSGSDDPFADPAHRVVALADFDRRIAHRTLTELRSYWHALQRGRAVPDRAEVDPRAIERTLEYAFILERVAAGHARFRIAGMHLNDLMGMEVRGMPLASFFTPPARQTLQELLEQVFSGPEIVEVTLAAEEGFGKPPMTARLLVMPLKSDLGDVSRALGCLVAEGQIGRAPRRFAITDAEVSAVIPGAPPRARTNRPDTAQHPAAAPSGLAEPAASAPTPMTSPIPPRDAVPRQPVSAAVAAPPVRPPGDDTPEARRARFHLVT